MVRLVLTEGTYVIFAIKATRTEKSRQLAVPTIAGQNATTGANLGAMLSVLCEHVIA
jgi:hypothetical protein